MDTKDSPLPHPTFGEEVPTVGHKEGIGRGKGSIEDGSQLSCDLWTRSKGGR